MRWNKYIVAEHLNKHSQTRQTDIVSYFKTFIYFTLYCVSNKKLGNHYETIHQVQVQKHKSLNLSHWQNMING